MTSWLNILLKFFAEYYLSRLQKRSERALKIKFTKMYIKGLIVSRHLILSALTLFLLLSTMLIGFVGLLLGLFYYLPWSFEHKVLALTIIAALFFLVPFTLLLYAFSQRTWARVSGVDEILENYAKDSSTPQLDA